ncbi:MFS transporter [Thauera linaloolentis]|uniref:Major facilitator superfamily protein n=1 Tax=Thauera linaloolentis (strain DSM 12138 / JCM 21573 / CCUG 41526 / CIP 105981 / IAM 15112 / NBRC 102519 / 47Lol) TaxID=1123367 RepID=N6XQV5_THAL4|nr:MFS transporter [Thauera linaloolentis]ENO84086.1 major facilitator superfamily protein [Thauera linaloolentis 47Lol = DSM 12138]MCM8564339.1 MFS transporter [Thauera linaloolentis]
MIIPLSITLAIQILATMAALTVPVLAPEAARTTGLPAALVGVFIALVYVGAMLSTLASGNLVGRYGAIRVSQACLLLSALGLAFAAVGAVWSLVVSALLIGSGYGPITPSSSHILARTTPAHRMGFLFSVKQTGVPLGGALAGLAVPPLVLLSNWQGAALAVGAACAAMALIAQGVRADFDADRDPRRKVSLGGVLRPLAQVFAHRDIRNLALCTFFLSAMQLCLTTYLVTYLTVEYGASLVTAGFVLSLSQFAGAGGRLLWGYAADRWKAPNLVLCLLAFAMAAASLITALFEPDWPLVIVIAVSMVFGATAIGWNGVYLARVAQLSPPGQAGTLTGGTLFFTYFGVVLGPPAFAALVGVSGSFAAGYAGIGGVILLVGVVLLYVELKGKR